MNTCSGCGHNWEFTWKEGMTWTYCPNCSRIIRHPTFEPCGINKYHHVCTRMKGHEGHHHDGCGAWEDKEET